MADIEKILESLNIPKQLLDKSEALLKVLFGQSFEEFGGLMADQVRLRRFNNQIKIFSKAQEKLKENKIDPKKVSLKVLAPLIEYSSLEEEENLQEKWANLIAHIVEDGNQVVFYQNCISILNKISSEEGKLIDTLHSILKRRRKEIYERKLENYNRMVDRYPEMEISKPKALESYSLNTLKFNMSTLSKQLKIAIADLEFSITNLISLGLLKWDTDVEVSASKTSENPEDTDIEVEVNVYNNDDFIFTSLGDKFIKICKN